MRTTLKTATDRLHATLVTAQQERGQRPNLMEGPDGPECEWARFERNAMWQEVNRIRGEHGFRPALLSDIVRVEQQAVGHSDYTSKFAFYCAEIATYEEQPAAAAAKAVDGSLENMFRRLGPPNEK